MSKRPFVVLLAFFILNATGCQLGPAEMRSGSTKDDYVEEPLAWPVRRFAPALESSNTMVEQIRSRQFAPVYQRFSPTVKASITEATLAEAFQRAEDTLGGFREFKPMQWNFSTGEDRGQRFVRSVKILRYEKADLLVAFVFPEDGPYAQVIGFRTQVRPRTASAAN